MKVLIAAGFSDILIDKNFDKYIGVDRGSLWLINNQLPLDLAVGDFDSVNSGEFEKIFAHANDMICLKTKKDETDLEVALSEVITRFPDAKYTMIGVLGGRLDHQLTNIYLPTTKKFCIFASQMTLIDKQNTIMYLLSGTHKIKKLPNRQYIGFVQINTGDTLEIDNAKYPLKAEENFASIYASNEFVDETMTVSFPKGIVIVIYSSDTL